MTDFNDLFKEGIWAMENYYSDGKTAFVFKDTGRIIAAVPRDKEKAIDYLLDKINESPGHKEHYKLIIKYIQDKQ